MQSPCVQKPLKYLHVRSAVCCPSSMFRVAPFLFETQLMVFSLFWRQSRKLRISLLKRETQPPRNSYLKRKSVQETWENTVSYTHKYDKSRPIALVSSTKKKCESVRARFTAGFATRHVGNVMVFSCIPPLQTP